MEFSVLVNERRSIRKYLQEDVNIDDIKQIIKCLQLAPSWKNSQTGRYYVALSEKYRNAVMECLPSYNQNSSKNASYIITTFKKDISGVIDNNLPDGQLWGSYDLGLQNAYLILKAKELGYDTLIMGIRDDDKLRELFNIPEDEYVMAVIAIGKKDQEVITSKRKELEEILVIK